MEKEKNKALAILVQSIPVLAMMFFIPFIKNDYLLTGVYVLILGISYFVLKHEKHDILFFVFGFFIMILAETLFVSTGVETFKRNTLFGLMPIWLPFLWGYSFVAMKRAIVILGV